MFLKVIGISKFQRDGVTMKCKDLWHPAKFMDAIKPLIGHSRSGICRRPIVPRDVVEKVAAMIIKAHAQNNNKVNFGVRYLPNITRRGTNAWKPSATSQVHEMLEKIKDKKARKKQESSAGDANKKCKTAYGADAVITTDGLTVCAGAKLNDGYDDDNVPSLGEPEPVCDSPATKKHRTSDDMHNPTWELVQVDSATPDLGLDMHRCHFGHCTTPASRNG